MSSTTHTPHWSDSNEASVAHIKSLRERNGGSSVNFRFKPKYQAGDLVMWGANRHRILSIDVVTPHGVYYQVQAIEGTCAFHKPIQAAESSLRSIGPDAPAQLQRGDVLTATDPEDLVVSTLMVSGEPWFNTADSQWYYPIENVCDRTEQGEVTDADLASGQVTRVARAAS